MNKLFLRVLTHFAYLTGGLTAMVLVMHLGEPFVKAEPPVLSNLVVKPDIIALGVGEQQVTISIQVEDKDNNLNPNAIKIKKLRVGKKNRTVGFLNDNGEEGDLLRNDGVFTGRILLDANIPREHKFKIKAKDFLKEKSVSVEFSVLAGPVLGLSSSTDLKELDLKIVRVFSGLRFSDPVDFLQDPDDDEHWYVVERNGIIKVFDNTANVMEMRKFLDITKFVEPLSELNIELGMLSAAFHPQFSENGEIYIYYTAQRNNVIESRLSRFTKLQEEDSISEDSEEILIQITQPRMRHNGGALAFGPDNFLYLSVGDGGDRFESQNTDSLLGKIIRIDVNTRTSYEIPEDNPFLQKNGKDEIYALGFRNPWRWSFDIMTGVLWLGDVGNKRWEEIDIVVPEGNYGWPVLEGNECAGFLPCETDTLVSPILTYSHNEGCSVIGGHVYRGTALAQLDGVYIYSDFCAGGLIGLSIDKAGKIKKTRLIEGNDKNPSDEELDLFVRSISLDNEGEIYIVDNNARLFKLISSE